MDIRWVSRGMALLGFVGEIYAFRIIRGPENVLESRLPGTYEQLSQRDEWDSDVEKLKFRAGVKLEEFLRDAGFQ